MIDKNRPFFSPLTFFPLFSLHLSRPFSPPLSPPTPHLLSPKVCHVYHKLTHFSCTCLFEGKKKRGFGVGAFLLFYSIFSSICPPPSRCFFSTWTSCQFLEARYGKHQPKRRLRPEKDDNLGKATPNMHIFIIYLDFSLAIHGFRDTGINDNDKR